MVQMKSLPIVFATLAFLLMGANHCHGQMTPAQTPSAARATPVLYITRIDSVPAEYARWYAATERCAGLTGDFSKVRWYLTPTPWTGQSGGSTYGMWQDGHRITLNKPEAMDSNLVMHEVMHDLLDSNGKSDPKDAHPEAYFGPTRCVYRFHP